MLLTITLTRAPAGDLGFLLHKHPERVQSFDLPGLHLLLTEVENKTAKFDLSLTLGDTGQGLAGSLEYSTDLFEPVTMSRMGEHFQKLLEGIAAKLAHAGTPFQRS